MWVPVNNLIKIPGVGDKVTVYKPINTLEYPYWDVMYRLDGTEVEVCTTPVIRKYQDKEFAVFKDMDGWAYNVWWLLPSREQKEINSDIYCNCKEPAFKEVIRGFNYTSGTIQYCCKCKKDKKE